MSVDSRPNPPLDRPRVTLCPIHTKTENSDRRAPGDNEAADMMTVPGCSQYSDPSSSGDNRPKTDCITSRPCQ